MRALFIYYFIIPFSSLAQVSIEDVIIREGTVDDDITIGDAVYTKDRRLSDFYKGVIVYSPILGKVANKKVQSFRRKRDKGNILYFEFDKPLPAGADDFFADMLYRGGKSPDKKHPATYEIHENLVIIYAFKQSSVLKGILEEHIHANLFANEE